MAISTERVRKELELVEEGMNHCLRRLSYGEDLKEVYEEAMLILSRGLTLIQAADLFERE